ncbi:MAG: response regulator transcription factor [Kineosporiaceae bacterium]|nr:response regulator transcription factor [Kineosporiaceae bacterium]
MVAAWSTVSGTHPLVLVVEDEAPIAELIRGALVREGFTARVCGDGSGALEAVRRDRPAVVVLDVGLPGLAGTEVCRRMREEGDWTPVLFVTARDEEVDRVLGLELGADDYVTKPFSPRELVARVRAVLRRGGAVAEQPTLSVGQLVLDPATRRASAAGIAVELTTTEFELLAHLMHRPGRVHTREELLAQVWGYPAGTPTRTVDVHVAQVRSKIGTAARLRTVRGVGYAVEPG